MWIWTSFHQWKTTVARLMLLKDHQRSVQVLHIPRVASVYFWNLLFLAFSCSLHRFNPCFQGIVSINIVITLIFMARYLCCFFKQFFWWILQTCKLVPVDSKHFRTSCECYVFLVFYLCFNNGPPFFNNLLTLSSCFTSRAICAWEVAI